MEAQKQKGFQDPLCVVLNPNQRTTELSVKPSAPEAPVHTDGSATSLKKASELVERDGNEATDSSSAWSPEVLQEAQTPAEGCRSLAGIERIKSSNSTHLVVE